MGDSASNEPWLAPGFNFFGHFKLAKVWLTSVWKRRLPHVEPEDQEKGGHPVRKVRQMSFHIRRFDERLIWMI